jgi:two-component system phosphate regulon sensor histidine kinase PhoR
MIDPFQTKRFPWQSFIRAMIFQAGAVLVLFCFAGIVTHIYFRDLMLQAQGGLISPARLNQAFRNFDAFLILCASGILTVFGVSSTLLARRLIFPIGRMLLRAKSILNRKIESLKTESEEQAILMSAISDAILAVDLDGAPLFYNSRLALLLGHSTSKHQQKLEEIFHDQNILKGFHEALKDGKTTHIKAIPFDLPEGRRFFSTSISPLRKENDSIYGGVGIFHDVTELKSAEQIRIDFVANVSHELRTPLTAIKGYTDTLVQDSRQGKPTEVEFLEIIHRNTNRLMNLINDLLDLSSLESTDVLHKGSVPLEDLCLRVLKQMQGTFESKQQKVSISLNATSVVADPKRLEQVLVNLLDNANKYTPCGSQIQIRWDRVEKDVLLRVVDSGPGISPEYHSRLFERFYRVDKARSREQGGTGLGLAIVKHIMQRHAGSVWVESTPGNGATFVCQFPD